MEPDRSHKYLDTSIEQTLKFIPKSSISSKPSARNHYPILNLPVDILAKIIVKLPVAQWPSLELLDEKFHDAILIAWRQLRTVNVDQDFTIESDIKKYAIAFPNTATPFDSFFQKLNERSPFLTSLSGIDGQLIRPRSSYASVVRTICCWRVSAKLHLDRVSSLAQFEHLQSITIGDPDVVRHQDSRRIPLEAVVELLESTRSRRTLKELRFFNIVQGVSDRAPILDRFATSFASGREIRSSLKLEKFSFSSVDHSLRIQLDTLDTSRLTELCIAKAAIEPQQLTNLIARAYSLRRVELSFLTFHGDQCNVANLQPYKELLAALARCVHLTAVKFDRITKNASDDWSYNTSAWTYFVPEVIQMLKDIGERGQFRKLTIEENFFLYAIVTNTEEICSTVCTYIPYLQSIKLCTAEVTDGSIFNIVSLTELEEIDLVYGGIPLTENIIKRISQLPRLKRLAIHIDKNLNSWKHWADIKSLRDLRIRCAYSISPDVWEKWSNGFASNLECFMADRIVNENGLVRFLEKAVRLRVLILEGNITDRSLKAIAQSCPKLETLGVESSADHIDIRGLHEIVNRCPKLNRLGGFESGINSLHLEKYRKIVDDVDTKFWKYNFDDVYD